MKSEYDKKPGVGRVTSGLTERDNLALKTIEFVRKQLTAWRDDPDRPNEQAEDRLSLQLCKFIKSRALADFPMVTFDREEYQLGRRRVDLSASPVESTLIDARTYTIYDPFLVFECKRLPSQDREKEYVTGEEKLNGGIQRFKLGFHGADLNLVAIIGYVQERSAREWHQDVNKWILELCSGSTADGCVWKDGETLELLEEDAPNGLASFWSVHNRTGSRSSNEIQIHHLWIAMNPSIISEY